MENRIRIGNDIKLSVHLFTSTYDPINIHSVQAYLINTTTQSQLEQQIKSAYEEYDNVLHSKDIKYISRFPMEPYSDGYCCTGYDICQCGEPTYNVKPRRCRFVYRGFGVYPHTFDAYKNHLYAKQCPDADKIMHAEDMYNKLNKFIKYQAHVESSDDINRIYVYFPGKDQLSVGVYKLIIVAQIYQPGYSKFNNLKTITVDYNDVFQLVDDASGISGDGRDIEIAVGIVESQNGIYNPSDDDIYVKTSTLSGNKINLRLSDGTQLKTNIIDVSPITDWYEGD